MPRFPVPEIMRTPLESLFLTVKAMDDTIDVKAFLSKAIDPPKLEAMDAAWTTLLDLGAVEGEEGSSRLTALGRHMSMIPVDLRLAKMLVLGAVFKCLDPSEYPNQVVHVTPGNELKPSVLTIASLLSAKPLFTSPLDKRDESKKCVFPTIQPSRTNTENPERAKASHGRVPIYSRTSKLMTLSWRYGPRERDKLPCGGTAKRWVVFLFTH